VGDHRSKTNKYLKQSQLAAEWINRFRENTAVLNETGLRGNTHTGIAFADIKNEEAAGLLD
jgi:RecA/RadA recombinase